MHKIQASAEKHAHANDFSGPGACVSGHMIRMSVQAKGKGHAHDTDVWIGAVGSQ